MHVMKFTVVFPKKLCNFSEVHFQTHLTEVSALLCKSGAAQAANDDENHTKIAERLAGSHSLSATEIPFLL